MRDLRIAVILLCVAATLFGQDLEGQFETGLLFVQPAVYNSFPQAAPVFAGVLPPRILLVPWATAGNQGQQGSCVGWAVAYALKTHQEEMERRWGISVPERVFSPSYVYNQVRLGDCMSGTYIPNALNLLSSEGVVPLVDFPYDPNSCHRLPTPALKQTAQEFRIASWRRVNTYDETEVKTALAAGFPVIIGMVVDQAFMNLRGDAVYQGPSGPSRGGHAMVTVGYDDERAAYRVLNSWGPEWADQGQGWISYTAFANNVREGYVVTDRSESLAASARDITIETTAFSEVSSGPRTTTATTGNHHCSSNCSGEPTRTNYRLDLRASPDSVLKNPKLTCIAGPCHGWNSVHFARVEENGKRVVASWDVWTEPTTWQLSADEVKIVEAARFTKAVSPGGLFTVISETGGPPPEITGKFSNGDVFTFKAGSPLMDSMVEIVSTEVQGDRTIYTFKLLPPSP